MRPDVDADSLIEHRKQHQSRSADVTTLRVVAQVLQVRTVGATATAADVMLRQILVNNKHLLADVSVDVPR